MIIYHVFMKGYGIKGGISYDHRWFLKQSTADACYDTLQPSQDALSYPMMEQIEVDET